MIQVEGLCQSCPRYHLADILYDKHFGDSLSPLAFSLLWKLFLSSDWDIQSNRFGRCSIRLSELAKQWDEDEHDLHEAFKELEEADLVRTESKRVRHKTSGQLITKQACSLRCAEDLKQSTEKKLRIVKKE